MGIRTTAPWRSECNKDILLNTNLVIPVQISQLLDLALGLLGSLWLDTSLLRDERRQALQVPTTLTVLWFAFASIAIEPLQRRETLDAVLLAKLFLSVGVDFGDDDLVLCEFERRGELFVDGREVLAVAAPGSEELDEGGFARLQDDGIEVLGREVDDGRGGGAGDGEGRGEELCKSRHGCDGVQWNQRLSSNAE